MTAPHGPALVVRGPHDLVVEQRTAPAPGPGQLLVTPSHVGLCGTDLEIIDGDLDPAYVSLPLVLGHEWSGRVAAVGANADDSLAGAPVVVEGVLACGVCRECRRGATNLCTDYDELGFTTDGALGPGVVVPAHLVHRLAADVPVEAGALVEPAAVVLRGLREIRPVPGDRVLVIGDGTVALLAAMLVRLWSPAHVTIAGRRAEQSELAHTSHADAFTTGDPERAAYDLVVEAAGSTAAVETAVQAVRRGGRVLVLGIAGHGQTARIPVDDLVNNDITLRGSFSYTAASWAEVVRLLNSGTIDPLPLVTHRFGLDAFEEAIKILRAGDGSPRGKVMFVLGEDAPR
ncbi:zinc-dependent alcohol dehydrogenase [Amycolatopsis pithecellobii]|uniref:Alcohol dehydrogenase catalytic domain-containing protein n=1 Tax=Amycolatopsis pithecellobii TaxID=664692 RepID=A0A6N7Z9W3_9PSEU|nr:alcohol dehydrogenase catalytic domain-containing protein [Amycolatopsis pithecellobii]MTD58526.1 alcohol dehydrogenase catalytic domain-containing protein [Amycolatopsis pithecellobii]